jgi:hypothetical protein
MIWKISACAWWDTHFLLSKKWTGTSRAVFSFVCANVLILICRNEHSSPIIISTIKKSLCEEKRQSLLELENEI